MTALDVFQTCAEMDGRIERIGEKIERRRVLATGLTPKPLSADGGGFGGGDASMRMLDYVAEVETLEREQRDATAKRERYRGCCLYLADLLDEHLSRVALRWYLEHKGIKAIAEELHYSQATIKRYRRQADEQLKHIEITYWDGEHVPIFALR